MSIQVPVGSISSIEPLYEGRIIHIGIRVRMISHSDQLLFLGRIQRRLWRVLQSFLGKAIEEKPR
jgi:hypothetical protein